MKIAIASSGLGHIARGNEAWAEDTACALNDRGVGALLFKGAGKCRADYERIVPCWERGSRRTAWLDRWVTRRLRWRFGLGSPSTIEHTTFAVNLLRSLRREGIDILHSQDAQVVSVVQGAKRLGLVPTRAILAHGTSEPLSFLKTITYLQHLAPWYLEEARRAGAWKPTWTAIPNFIDMDRFMPARDHTLRDELGIPRDGLVVLTVAAIQRGHKRIDYLLDEFARLLERGPNLPVWLVVAGGREAGTDDLIREGRERLGDRVRFLVRFPRARIPLLYRAADLFVLTSLREMFGIVLLEASASGLPCLVHRHPVIEWVVGPGGEAIDMEQPGELEAALARLASDPSGRERLGALAREHCRANFGRDRVVGQFLDYYRFVLDHVPSRCRQTSPTT